MIKRSFWNRDPKIPPHLQEALTKERLTDNRRNILLLSILITAFTAALLFQHIFIPGVDKGERIWWLYFWAYIAILGITPLAGLFSRLWMKRLDDQVQQGFFVILAAVLISGATFLATLDLTVGEDTSAYLLGLFALTLSFRLPRLINSLLIGLSGLVILVLPRTLGSISHSPYVYLSLAIYAILALWLTRNLENKHIESLIYQGELAEANQKLLDLSLTDSLTGIHNRRAFFEHTAVLVEQCKRYLLDLSIAIIDVDKFKRVNDTFGHPAGDQVLIQIAQHLQKATRTADITARFGGEEFIVAMSNTNLKSAEMVMERVRKEIAYLHIPEVDWPITISIGVAMYHPTKETFEDTITRSDQALYDCKAEGGNLVKAAKLADDQA